MKVKLIVAWVSRTASGLGTGIVHFHLALVGPQLKSAMFCLGLPKTHRVGVKPVEVTKVFWAGAQDKGGQAERSRVSSAEGDKAVRGILLLPTMT